MTIVRFHSPMSSRIHDTHVATCDTCGTSHEYQSSEDRALQIQLTLDDWHQEDGSVSCGGCHRETLKEEQ